MAHAKKNVTWNSSVQKISTAKTFAWLMVLKCHRLWYAETTNALVIPYIPWKIQIAKVNIVENY